jgi:hypothetical protein
MSAPDSEIFQALLTRYASFTATPQPLLAYPGIDFKEPNGDQLWLEARLFPSEPGRVSAAGEVANYLGYLQVTVCQKRGYGAMGVARLADKVAEHFPKGLQLVQDSVRIKISRTPGVASVFEDDGKVKLPVAVYYQSIA